MPKVKIDNGPTAVRVAANVQQLRQARGWTLRELADALKTEGRLIDAPGVKRLESGERRVSVDDLVALACALDVTVDRLLLPMDYSEDGFDLTERRRVSTRRAWDWARGIAALPRRADEGPAYWARGTRRWEEGLGARLLDDDELRDFPRRPPGEWRPDVLPDQLWRQVAGEETRSHLPWEPVDTMRVPGETTPSSKEEG